MPRSLVLCFDGTGDSFDDDRTNVVRFVEALEKQRPDKQLYYYQPGIGTYLPPTSMLGPFRRWFAKRLDEGFAWYLDGHILGGYRFLMENYQAGDYICLFGFSRGAYTARCLAGMLHKVGLLPKTNEEQVEFAYQKYLDGSDIGKKAAYAFKRAFSTAVPIKFVGVWDTVASAGYFFKHLAFSDSNNIIRHFRHALALDEHRVEFMPNPWHVPSRDPDKTKLDPDQCHGGWMWFPKQIFNTIFMRGPVDAGGDEYDDWEYHDKPSDVKEVWFAGCHADVGGGATLNSDLHTLANPSLQWMISEVIKHAPYVLFRPDAFPDDNAFSTLTITKTDSVPRRARPRIPSTFRDAAGDICSSTTPAPVTPLTGVTASSTLNGTELEEEETVVAVEQTEPETDANAPKHDQLLKAPLWLILEFIPIFQYYQDGYGKWHWRFRWNKLRPREIYSSAPNFHASVRLRRDYEGKWLTKFIPKAGEEVKINYVE